MQGIAIDACGHWPFLDRVAVVMHEQPIRPLILALSVSMAPLVRELPWWAITWCAGSWGYLLLGVYRGWGALSRSARLAIFVVGLATVLVAADLRFDGGDFLTLLAVMAGLKPLEIRSRRDSMVTVFLAYFLVITSLFVFENLFMTLYLFGSVWITTGVLIRVTHPEGQFGAQMRLAGRLVVLGIPLTVALFLLFPRSHGHLWGSPWSGHNRTGFSSTLRLGAVTQLVKDDATAFTVTFDTSLPAVEDRYWRGIVFAYFDGAAWYPAPQRRVNRDEVSGTRLSRYTVILEPHGYRRLFALDWPLAAPPSATLMEDYTLLSRRPLKRRHRYAATSVMDIRPVHAQLRAETYLQLPPGRNPRTLALGRQLARRHTDVDAIVEAGLAFLRDNPFVYSLTPDRLGRDAVDDFLFRSRNGFCEHFATAYAVLMRAAGVPARVVGGYQGGRWNSLGEFLTVRQTDAHAWCEVWRPERGWTRVDPTLVVAPDRIGNGLEAVAGAMQGYFGRQGKGWLGPWIEGLRLTWEAVDTRWQMAFMAFSADEQMTFLARLGLSAGRHGRLALVAMVTLLFVGMVFFVKRWRYPTRRAARVDEALIIYRRFLSKMNRIGLPKPPHQGPWDYSRAVITRQPVLMADVEAITRRYIQLRYASQGDATGLDAFRRQVRAFRPRRLLADRADRVDVFPPPHSAH